MARSLTVNVKIEGAKEAIRALNRLPKEASQAVREESMKLAQTLAGRARAAAVSDRAPQSKLIAPTIRARRDRLPTIQAGGTTRVGRRRVAAWRVLFGAEFGSDRFGQFGRVHSGRKGYWFFPLAEREAETIAKAWRKVTDRIIRAYSGGR